MTPEELLQYGLPVASAIASAGAWLYGWQGRKHSAHADEVRELELRIHALELELSITRERLQHIPSTGHFHELAGALGELRGDHKALYSTVKGMGDQISTIAGTLTRIDDYLRDKGK